MSIDWGIGRYETTAEQLLPAAGVAVDAAGIGPGMRVLDIGCGTGNAAVLAAQRGADVIAVDPALRLREVAGDRAAAAGLTVDVRAGTAADLPVADGTIDVALSVFAVIFAPDPAAAAAEIARVLTPTGRLVMTAWTPRGPWADVYRLAAQLAQEALGGSTSPAPFQWHEAAAVANLFAPYGFAVRSSELPIAFTAPTPEAAYDQGAENPVTLTAREELEAAGHGDVVDRIRTLSIAVLRDHNEDPGACRVTSRYALHVIDRHHGGQGGT